MHVRPNVRDIWRRAAELTLTRCPPGVSGPTAPQMTDKCEMCPAGLSSGALPSGLRNSRCPLYRSQPRCLMTRPGALSRDDAYNSAVSVIYLHISELHTYISACRSAITPTQIGSKLEEGRKNANDPGNRDLKPELQRARILCPNERTFTVSACGMFEIELLIIIVGIYKLRKYPSHTM